MDIRFGFGWVPTMPFGFGLHLFSPIELREYRSQPWIHELRDGGNRYEILKSLDSQPTTGF